MYQNMKNGDIQNIVQDYFRRDMIEKLMHYPAAKSNHHAYKVRLIISYNHYA